MTYSTKLGYVNSAMGTNSHSFFGTFSEWTMPPPDASLAMIIETANSIVCGDLYDDSQYETSICDAEPMFARTQTESRTMLILRHIPCKVTKACLRATLDDLGYADMYDFVNLPTKRNGKHGAQSNVGYAFVNFVDPKIAENFMYVFQGFQFPSIRSAKACSVEYANDQRGRGQGLQSTNPLSLQAPEAVEVPLVTKWCLSFQ
eukprot:TRINITY_DN17192_c0_g1_i1.p1 TRINITY_DN17192_c0_g1~~TRINITY_DN17192_c0_g1_i1.p1  ORF type:complete len:203 (+),score=24.68 TRINITY_DN17192_c0_g1_i1:62-670(+)